jgi:hypothetical protein
MKMSDANGWADTIVAVSVLVTALTAAYVSLRRKVGQVHKVVNSRYDALASKLEAVESKLAVALTQRDEARRGYESFRPPDQSEE